MILLIFLIFQDSLLLSTTKINRFLSSYEYNLNQLKAYRKLDTSYQILVKNHDTLLLQYSFLMDLYRIKSITHEKVNQLNVDLKIFYQNKWADYRSILYGLSITTVSSMLGMEWYTSILYGTITWIGDRYVF